MKIKPIMLPGNGLTVSFRAPTVEDCIELSTFTDDQSQIATSLFLNNAMDNAHDSATWSVYDRMMAVYWIFVHTHKNNMLKFEYQCVCGATHSTAVDMTSLLADVRYPDQTTMQIQAGDSLVTARAITGAEAEHLEMYRAYVNNLSEQEHDTAALYGKLRELSCQFDIQGQPDDTVEAIEHKVQFLKSLQREDYREFVYQLAAASKVIKHGLLTGEQDGELTLISQVMTCPKEEHHLQLQIPFRYMDFIPTL